MAALLALLASLLAVSAQLAPSPTYNPPPAASGTAPSTSSPNTQWSTVLGNSLWFYDAQRSGRLDAGTYGNRVEWRNDSALEDGSDWGIDLSGGWYDAGDVSGTRCSQHLTDLAVHQSHISAWIHLVCVIMGSPYAWKRLRLGESRSIPRWNASMGLRLVD